MASYIIGGAILILCTLVIYQYARNLRQGKSCCTDGSEPVKKVRVSDRNKNNYSFTSHVVIDGMTCGNCARRVENALNVIPGCWATVDLSAKSAVIRSKSTLDENEVRRTVHDCGYTVMEIHRQ